MALPPSVDIAAAQAAQRKWRVPTSVQRVQDLIESSYGAHEPAGSLNPFGIKAKPGDPFVLSRTREEDKAGHSYFIQARFRKFATLEEAFDLHARLLATAPVYALAMAALRADTPATHAAVVLRFIQLMAPHYATAHNYADVLWRNVQPLLHLDQLPAVARAA